MHSVEKICTYKTIWSKCWFIKVFYEQFEFKKSLKYFLRGKMMQKFLVFEPRLIFLWTMEHLGKGLAIKQRLTSILNELIECFHTRVQVTFWKTSIEFDIIFKKVKWFELANESTISNLSWIWGKNIKSHRTINNDFDYD